MLRKALKLLLCAQMLLFAGTAMAQDVTSEQASGTVQADTATASEEAATEGESTDAGESPKEEESPKASGSSGEVLTDAMLDKQLQEVSTSIDALKEDTFTTKSRLLLLREEVLQRSVNGSRLQLRHRYDMGGQYELIQVFYAIDQETVYSKQDLTGKLSSMNDEVVFDKMLPPGPHQVSVLYVYRGKAWGVFQYMKDYMFRVESGYDFVVDEGKAGELVVTASEQGDAFTAYQNRPGVKYQYQQFDLTTAKISFGDKETSSEKVTK